ncbi:hypothetical protein BDQ12DRAFT_696362 [Crucibulum laeve]|uniref:Uncharacterized protein n=1 Tax=Crucibulum laeve TaxID=68775 RepID=A0A5C3MCT2_9AGAR|nr:hypothetical protein BDQ12DRAFT_696362 [Crucibulum laeve]
MHRFRKKSDAKRIQVPFALQAQSEASRESLPELPPAGDFRTSLILPESFISAMLTTTRMRSLSRRFSVLRSPSGDPVTIEDLRYRFAEQRARGSENHITEEEEDMLLETLGRLRSRTTATPERSQENVADEDDPRQSVRSGNTTASSSFTGSSINSSPSSARSKRYSNNLFGSGRHRDYSYVRSVTSSRGAAGSTRTVSLTPTESSTTTRGNSISESLRPVTPDRSASPPLVQSSPGSNEKPAIRSAPYGEQQPLSAAEYRLAKTLGPSLKRASMALEEVIKEIEDEVDVDAEDEEEIVMPRTVPVPRGGLDHSSYTPEVRQSNASNSSAMFEAGMAISSDKQILNDLEERRASPVPSRILPGYIPGMPRPMTPRDFDSDDLRSHSTTPRATSPMHSSSFSMDSTNSSPGVASITSGLLRRESTSSRQSPHPTTPLASPLFLQRTTNGRYTPDDSNHYRGDSYERRPASPLSGAPTPSNPGHNQNNSWVSDGGVSSSEIHVRSPALPDSPTLDRSQGHPSSSTSEPLLAPAPPRSPTSPNYATNFEMSSRNGSRRSSKQNGTPSPFNVGSFPSLSFSPMANSSRTSLESGGSSFHSLFNDGDPAPSSSDTPEGSPDDEWDADDIIKRYTGLKKHDFVAIQEKLVGAAVAKAANPEQRAPSSMRKRRPSTAQSTYSNGGRDRVASPPPGSQPPASPTSPTSPTSPVSASALLNSVVDSIESRESPSRLNIATSVPASPRDPSPTTRRNRDLAQVLFGGISDDERDAKTPKPEQQSAPKDTAPTHEPITTNQPEPVNIRPTVDRVQLTDNGPVSPPTSPSPYQLHRNPSTPRIPHTPQEEADLTREVQKKTEAAMLALRPNASLQPEGVTHSGSIRKRISPNQISTPQLISATTSVDTIPLRSPSLSANNNAGPSKIGTLRAKNTIPAAEEVTPSTPDPKSPLASAGQTATYDPANATETGRFKLPVPSPPASAGPGLRGFMARFRNKPRMAETPSESEHRVSPQPPASSIKTPSPLPSISDINYIRRSPAATSPLPTSLKPVVESSPDSNESAAVRHLGLDRDAVKDLLARSGSTLAPPVDSSGLAQSNSIVTIPKPGVRDPDFGESAYISQATYDNTPYQDSSIHRNGQPIDPVSKRTSGQGLSENANNPIGAGVDVNTASAISVSSRSIHDRAPTPPPPKSPVGGRFSADGPSPPVPQLPHAHSQNDNRLNLPSSSTGGPIEKSNSTYESLYEMYAGESRAVSSAGNDPNGTGNLQASDSGPASTSEQGPALEFVELANGETIWSIVNGLRDDDDESVYTGRGSFASEYSTREPNSEGVQIFVKEHGRAGSKGSTSSFLSRKKTTQGKVRPETKVFYSSSAQIGRLIENLSQGMDAGSFNFLPTPTRGTAPGHSTSSSLSTNDMHWTVEERLEHMLGSMKST